MSRVLCTGGSGFIGKHLIKRLETMYDVDNRDYKENSDVTKIQVLKSYDMVFHLAAMASVEEVQKNPRQALKDNVMATAHIAQKCLDRAIPLIHISSASVYNPISTYGVQKLLGEHLVKDIGTKAVILRPFNVYGEGQTDSYAGVVKKFIKQKKKGEPLKVHGNGKQTRDFVYVADVVNAIIMASSLVDNKLKTYDIGAGSPMSILELAKGIGGKVEHDKERDGDIKESCSDRKRWVPGWSPSGMTPIDYAKTQLA